MRLRRRRPPVPLPTASALSPRSHCRGFEGEPIPYLLEVSTHPRGTRTPRVRLRRTPVPLPTAPRAVPAVPLSWVRGITNPVSIKRVDPPARDSNPPRPAAPFAGPAPDSAPRCLRGPTVVGSRDNHSRIY